jgi:TfoX/Sxy family transcriptional regulator of competence genes
MSMPLWICGKRGGIRLAVDESYREYVEDLLAAVEFRVTFRPMFGGAGLYRGGRIVGVIVSNELYLKLLESPTGETGLPRFGRQYLQVPPEVLEDTELLRKWTLGTVQAR